MHADEDLEATRPHDWVDSVSTRMPASPRPAAAARPSRLAVLLAAVSAVSPSCEGNERTRDTRVLYEAILAEYATQDAILCPCEVEEGKYESVQQCEGRHVLTDDERECIHGVLMRSKDAVVESLWCMLDAEEAFTACVEKVTCATPGRLDCAIAHSEAIGPCDLPSPVAAEIEVDCFGAPMLRCMDGQIITEEMLCDGDADCADGTDERNCPGRFSCRDGSSVPEVFACDGEADCGDASDETLCDGFTCGDGAMIPADWACDGESDCDDGSDESGCSS